jgi:hypothetical protein
MKRVIKWTAIAFGALAAVAFLAFLYVMPPLFLIAPETYGRDVAQAAPPVDRIADPARRAIAERGRSLVMNTGCLGCHAANGELGPDYTRYLAGGGVKIESRRGTYVSRNLTPDPGALGAKSDEEVMRVLRSGTFPDGHVVPYTTMPWASFSRLTEEDRYAIVVYLRSIPPVAHRIPDPSLQPAELPEGAVLGISGLKDYGIQ